jgi:hypothetical protein
MPHVKSHSCENGIARSLSQLSGGVSEGPSSRAVRRYVDPSTYQILGNLKIVTTGILFRLFLKRKLNVLQWWALILLMVGATVSQINGCGDRTFTAPMEVLNDAPGLHLLPPCSMSCRQHIVAAHVITWALGGGGGKNVPP